VKNSRELQSYIELLKLILPVFLIENFNLTSFKNSEENLHLYLEEKASVPKEFASVELVSKGFLDEITIQDFPLRGKFVYLHIKRRRWANKTTGKVVFSPDIHREDFSCKRNPHGS
jgi:hypothetical protein